MLIYVSGPYTDKTYQGITENITQARKIATHLWELGFYVICPHLNTAHFEEDCKATYEDYIKGDLVMVSRCDAIVMTPRWEQSKGANIERDHALSLDIPVFEYPDELYRLMAIKEIVRNGKAVYI